MKEMLVRIGAKRPKFFGVANITQGFYQMPLHENSRAPSTFICFRGVYEWTRVPMGLFPSANFFQKSMSCYVFHEPLYQIREVYIDDLMIYGDDDDCFVQNVRTIFQKCREKNVTLSAKKLYLGFDTVQFVGHELDSTGINMTQNVSKALYSLPNPTV